MRHAISVDANKAKWTDVITSSTAHLTIQAVHVMRSVPMNNVALPVVCQYKYSVVAFELILPRKKMPLIKLKET